jgi:glycosyltransferase involved in cell wall biosynthesis
MRPDQPSVSVIIPTYNGATKIPSLLDSLLKQSFQDFETIVVVDGSTDNTVMVLEKYRTLLRKFKVIVQPNSGRARVRNNGFRESSGGIVIFFDDDMIPMPNVVERHIWFHQNNIHSFCTGNSVEFRDTSKTDIQNYKASLNVKWTEKYDDGLNRIDFTNLFFTAANCSMRREDFERFGGFDERLNDAEDYDLAYRALEAGFSLYFDKDNKAIHQDVISCASYIRRLNQYREAHEKLMRLHPERAHKRVQPVAGLKKLIYFPFSLSIWKKIIDSTSLLKIFPAPLRFKIYDWVIFASSFVYPQKPSQIN